MVILQENCHTFADRKELELILESSAIQLDATMVSKLYKSAIDKSHVFDTFEDSKGDITKFEGYANMQESLDIVNKLATMSGVRVKEINVVKDAISILEGNREMFMKGFLIENEPVILIYNTVVMACIEATSVIISSYVDFVRNVDIVEFKIVKNNNFSQVSIDNLERFIASSRKGDLTKVLREATMNRDNFLGSTTAGSIVIGATLIGAALTVVPVIRELAFMFYYSRARASEYLEHQALLIDMNKKSVEASSLPLSDRRKVAKRQADKANELRRYADKIKIRSKRGELEAHTAMKTENKSWTVEETKKDMLNDSSNGFQLL